MNTRQSIIHGKFEEIAFLSLPFAFVFFVSYENHQNVAVFVIVRSNVFKFWKLLVFHQIISILIYSPANAHTTGCVSFAQYSDIPRASCTASGASWAGNGSLRS